MEFVEPPEWIPVLPKPGSFTHPSYGTIELTRERNANFVRNFQQGVYQKRLPVNAEHQEKVSGALGWIVDARQNSDGTVDGRVEWTNRGATMLGDNRFSYVSPEWYDSWVAPESDTKYNDVLIGAALTTRPFFKEGSLRPLVASEQGWYLLDTALQPVAAGETAPPAPRAQPHPSPVPPPGAHGTQQPPRGQEVPMSAPAQSSQFSEEEIRRFREMEAENAALKQAAEQNKQAAEQALEVARQASEHIAAMHKQDRLRTYAEQARAWYGDKAKHAVFMESLDEEQRAYFAELMTAQAVQVRQAGLFGEQGRAGTSPDADPSARLDALVTARMEKDGIKSRKTAAMKVMAEHPDLAMQARKATEIHSVRSGFAADE